YFIIPKFGWHIAFLIGGLPLIYILVIWKKVPESIPYLINRGRIEEAHALVQKLEAEACVQIVHHIEVVPVAMRQKVSFKQL
ncbi:MFS transporter, partial [Acinetobacter baumannii]